MSNGSPVQARDTALSEFDTRRAEFEAAVRRAPDAALRYCPPGEDYALGGLVVHVSQVLRHYTAVLEAIHAADWQTPTAPPDHQSEEDSALVHGGFAGDRRAGVLQQMCAAHDALVEVLRAEPADWFTRKAPVTYSGSSEPYPTSPADVLGWVRDHYVEHAQQVTNLVSTWAEATR